MIFATAAIIVVGSVLAQAGGDAPAAASPSGAASDANGLEVSSVLDFFLKGGWPMVPIALCSLVALAIIIERAMVIRRSRVVPKAFVQRMNAAAHDRAKALELARSNRSPISRIFAEAVKRADEPREALEKHVEEVGGRELVPLRSNMRVLSALPQVATMLGLLGTVFGMIKTFQQVAASSEALGKTEQLADGIFEAWTCTAGGLIVAIPVLIAFHWLMGRIDTITADVDRTASEFVERMTSHAAVVPARGVESPRALRDGQADGVAPSPAVASA